MKVLVTGGAGFIGRWVAGNLLGRGIDVVVLDNYSNSSRRNIEEFAASPRLREVIEGDIKDVALLRQVFRAGFDACVHLAAQINVQSSIDNPERTFANDVVGTFNLLERAREAKCKFIFVSSCMVYDRADGAQGISETHPVKPASPYAASKLSGEHLALSYYHAYGLPVVVLRPFNTYGPFQKSTGEGGVIAVFIERKLKRQVLQVYGDGTQTRDFLFASDCAEFIAQALMSEKAVGQVINAGSGRDIPVNELARLIESNKTQIRNVPHIHPQSEIPRLLCDISRAKSLLGWSPKVSLREGIAVTERWLRETANQ